MIQHRDETNGFAFWYPKSWSKAPTTYAKTKVKIVSDKGAGEDDFNVVVVSDPAFKQITADKLVTMMLGRPEALAAQLRTAYPDAKIIKTGKTQLDNKAAHYVIFDGTFRALDVEVPMRFLQVFTIQGGRGYYLTSRTDPEKFEAMKPVFTLIAGSFKLLER